jgi:hypothetical protein
MALTGTKIWIQAVGSSIVTANVFLMLTAFASAGLLLLTWFDVKILKHGLNYQIYVVVTILALAICCILMSLSTHARANGYEVDIEDYCKRKSGTDIVTACLRDYQTAYTRIADVEKRTTDFYSGIAAFFALWVIALGVLLFCLNRV